MRRVDLTSALLVLLVAPLLGQQPAYRESTTTTAIASSIMSICIPTAAS